MKLFLFLLAAAGMFACSSEGTGASKNTAKFEVTDDFCEEMGLPLIHFSLEYPKHLKTDLPQKGQQNYNYNAFVKLNAKEVQTEGISLGYYTPSGMGALGNGLNRNILSQVETMYGQLFEVSESEIGEQTFDGKKYLMLRAKGKGIKTADNTEFVGDYLIQSLFLEPEGDNKNGLMITFLGNEQSPYKTFEDFASKGDISVVWKTLKFE